MAMAFKDELFDAQWLRALGHSCAGGAEAGECFAVARDIREGDAESWFTAWTAMAERLEREADQSRAAGHAVSAIGGYLRAANYFRSAYFFLIGAPDDGRLAEAWRRQRTAFRAALALMAPAGEAVEIPYEGGSLPGYLIRPPGEGPFATLIVNGGYDSTAEEGWFFSGAAAVARGYACLLFDGPGQGGALIERGLTFRPDWEAVIAPVVNFAESRAEIDARRIALIGISFGGYLAPRAASAEPRLAACIADPGEYSLFEELKTRLPGFIARELPNGNRLMLGLVERIMRGRMRKLTAGWGLRRGLWTHGLDSPMDYLRETVAYSLEGRAENIACPTLVACAEDDEIGVTARRLYDALTCEKTFIAFARAEGAGAHCEAGARSLFNQRQFDWLDAVLARRAEGG
jgi:pimeloyl-ACP methyl ester carboxylesterase